MHYRHARTLAHAVSGLGSDDAVSRVLAPYAHDAASPVILTFLHAFGPGGGERVGLRLVRGLRDSGVDARLFLGRADGQMQADLDGDTDFRVARGWRLARAARWRTIWMILHLPHVIRRERPDVLFCPGNAYGAVAVAMKLLLGRRCPPILAKISNDLHRRDMHGLTRAFYRIWLRIQGRYIDEFVSLSPGMVEQISTCLNIPRNRVHILPNPVLRRDAIREKAVRDIIPDGKRRFIAVGRLEPQKDYPLMLRAFATGSVAGDTLTIVGDGDLKARLEALAGELGVADRVRFAGHRGDVLALLRGHHILLLSSRYEGLPGAVVEALSCGLNVIATNCSPSMPGLLEGGRLGALVAIGDAPAMAAAITTARPGTQDERLARAQARLFTVEAAAPAYLATFTKIAQSHRRSR